MLSRSSSSVCIRATAAGRQLLTSNAHRASSTAAALAPVDAAVEDVPVAAPAKPTVPRAITFGDIHIPSKAALDAQRNGMKSWPEMKVLSSEVTGSSPEPLATNVEPRSPQPRRDSQREQNSVQRQRTPYTPRDANSARQSSSRDTQRSGERVQRASDGQRDGARNQGQRWSQDTPRAEGQHQQQHQRQPRQQERERQENGQRGSTRTQAKKERNASQASATSPSKQQSSEPSARETKADAGPAPKLEWKRKSIESTDLEALFGPAPTSEFTPSIALSRTGNSLSQVRVQHFLEHTAGDYSRYLSPTLIPTHRVPTPVQSAQLALARNRDVGLGVRQKALGVVSQLSRAGTTRDAATTKVVA